MQDVNRLKLVLVEQKKGGGLDIDNIVEGYPSKWLSEELGVNPSTVSKWCTNSSQPDIETLARISKLLGVGVEEMGHHRSAEGRLPGKNAPMHNKGARVMHDRGHNMGNHNAHKAPNREIAMNTRSNHGGAGHFGGRR